MQKPPSDMLMHLNSIDLSTIEKWWGQLDSAKQIELEHLYCPEKEKAITVTFCARNIGEMEEPSENEVWIEELDVLYEYLVNHEVVAHGFPEYIGGTCQQHPVAKNILRTGLLKGDFACPLSNSHCPMLHIAAYFAHQDVRLFMKFKGENR